MNSEVKTLSHHAIPIQLTKEHLRILSKAHAIEVLGALSESEDGLRYTDIQYDVVRSSSVANLLKKLMEVGFIEQIDDSYHITSDGESVLILCRPILEFGEE